MIRTIYPPHTTAEQLAQLLVICTALVLRSIKHPAAQVGSCAVALIGAALANSQARGHSASYALCPLCNTHFQVPLDLAHASDSRVNPTHQPNQA